MGAQDLSAAEVDALLAGAGTLPPAQVLVDADLQPGDDAAAVRPYDLARQERIVRGRMPTLEAVHERFARHLRVGLAGFLRRACAVSAGPVRTQRFDAFLRGVALPASVSVVHVRPLRGSGLLICDPALVFALIETLFGGSGGAPEQAQPREFSATEQRIVLRLVEVITREYSRAWTGIHPIELAYARSEPNPQAANIAAPSETMVTASFDLRFGEAGGSLHLCIPYATFEPIREVLYAPLPGDPGDPGAPDRRWHALLTQQLQSATVEVAAELAHGQATVRELLALQVGDFVALDRAATLVAKVDGVPVFECDYGTLAGRYGLRIREFLTQLPVPAAPRA